MQCGMHGISGRPRTMTSPDFSNWRGRGSPRQGFATSGAGFDTSPYDPATLILTAITPWGVVLLASAAPAWRATRIDPVDALRSE